jgi:predicted DNA-binding transcriptional regulator
MRNNNFELMKGRLSTEEARKIGKKGGAASVKARREMKRFRKLVEAFGDLPAPERVREVMKELGISQEDLTNNMAAVVGLFQRAIKGDVNAFNAIRDIRGEKPVNESKTSLVGSLDNTIQIGFVETGVEPLADESE